MKPRFHKKQEPAARCVFMQIYPQQIAVFTSGADGNFKYYASVVNGLSFS